LARKKVGSLLVEIETNLARIQREVTQVKNIYARTGKDIERALGPVNRAVEGLSKHWMKFVTVAGAAMITRRLTNEFRQLYTETTKYGDSLAKMGKALGVTTESLSTLQYVAKRSGASVEQMNTGLRLMLKNVGDAAQGIGEAKKVLEAYNIDIASLARQKPEEIFARLAGVIQKLPTTTERAAVASRIFGRNWATLMPMFLEGEAGIKELTERFRELGGAVSTEFGAESERAQNALTDLQTAIGGLKRDLAEDLAPTITNVVEKLTEMVAAVKRLREQADIPKQSYAGILDYLRAVREMHAGGLPVGGPLYGPRGAWKQLQEDIKKPPQLPPEPPPPPEPIDRYPVKYTGKDTTMDAAVEEFKRAQEQIIQLEREAKDTITELTLGVYELKKQELQRWLEDAVKAAEKAGVPADIYYQAYSLMMGKLAQEQAEAMGDLEENFEKTKYNLEALAEDANRTMSSSIANFTSNAITNFKNVGEAFTSLITGMIADMARIMTHRAMSGFIEGLLPFHGGGLSHDEVPAVLQAGEFVVQKDAVSKMPMQFWEGLNRMHVGGAAGAIPSFDTGGAVKYGPFSWGGHTYTSAMMAAMHGGADPRATYGPGWTPRTGSPLNPMFGMALTPEQVLRSDAYKIWEQRYRPAPGPRPLPPPGPGPAPGPSPYIPMPPPDYPPDFPPTGPDIPWEFLPINLRVHERYVPEASRKMYEQFGYDPWAGMGIMEPAAPQWNRWEMPRMGADLGKFMETFGMNVRGDWSLTPEMYQKFGGMTEPLAVLSLLSGIRMDQLSTVGEIQKLMQSYEATPFDIRGKHISSFLETGSIARPGGGNVLDRMAPDMPAGAILSELMEALYFRLGVGGTMTPEHLTTDVGKFMELETSRDIHRLLESLGKVTMKEGGVNMWGEHLGHVEGLGTRMYYDMIINEAMKYMQGPGAQAGYMSGLYPDWVHYGHPEGGAYDIGRPGAWMPKGVLTAMHQGGFLRANEVPAILERGEVVLPKYHDGGVVGGGGGAGGSPLGQKITINVINKTPLQVEAHEEFSMDNFREVIKTITLTAVRTDPAYRAMLRGY